MVETDATALFEATTHVQIEKLRRKEGGFVCTMDGVADGGLVCLIWDKGFKVAGDGALAMLRGTTRGRVPCLLQTKTVSNLIQQ